jgi:hypothetical protein
VSWSLLPYEADIIAVSKGGKVHEIEIKISKADLAADAKKQRWRMPPYVDCYWLAVPQELKDAAIERAGEIGAGVFSASKRGDVLLAYKIKEPRRWLKRDAKPLLQAWQGGNNLSIERHRGYLRNQVWRLAALRYWDIVFKKNQ